ncbi:MAG TPA: hypothetical protein VM661_09895 [Candidatus Sulfotelmatobacter sp.]|jgi:hypothetical protein|nr:hypothetical protein [Candidatus Sulfotelmatobacter sp.]
MSIWKDADGLLHDDMDGAAIGLPSWPQGMTLITDDEAAALRAPTAEEIRANFVAASKTALAATSTTMERITEAVALGKTAWGADDVQTFLAYRAALRAIVSGDDATSTELPQHPGYPANT